MQPFIPAAWLTTPNWLGRLKSTIYYNSMHGPLLYRQSMSLISDIGNSTTMEFTYLAALLAVRRVNPNICYCNDHVCPPDRCDKLQGYARIPLAIFNIKVDELLINNFGTNNITCIINKLKEYQKQKIK